MGAVFDTRISESLCGGDTYVKAGINGENESFDDLGKHYSRPKVWKSKGVGRRLAFARQNRQPRGLGSLLLWQAPVWPPCFGSSYDQLPTQQSEFFFKESCYFPDHNFIVFSLLSGFPSHSEKKSRLLMWLSRVTQEQLALPVFSSTVLLQLPPLQEGGRSAW